MSRLVLASVIASGVLVCAPARAEDGPAPAASGGVAFESGTPAWADVLAKAKAAGKPAFVDFSTVWCGWCRRMEHDTFSEPSVGAVMRGFLNVRLDAEAGEGPALVRRYGVHGYPTMLVVDAAGDEVDRIVGYLPPKEFTAEAQRILRGEGTIPALRRRVAEAPDDVDAAIALASKLAVSKPDDVPSLFDPLVAKAAAKDRPTEAKVRLAYASALVEAQRGGEALAQAEAIVRRLADTPAAAEVVPAVGRAVLEAEPARALAFLDAARPLAKDPRARFQVEDMTVAVLQNQIGAALARAGEAAGDDPEMLNHVAWTCFEQKVNLQQALGWATKAVEVSHGAPEILDTLANLQWLLDQREPAITTETRAVAAAQGDLKAQCEATLAGWKAVRDMADAAAAGGARAPEPPAPKDEPKK